MKLKISVFLVLCLGTYGLLELISSRNNDLILPLFSNAPSSQSGQFQSRSEYNLMRLADPETGKIPDNIRVKELEFASGLPKNNVNGRSVNWTSRGPWNVGGRTRALAVDVTNENIILAGGVSGGLWRTENGGQSWVRVTTAGEHPGVNAIVQDRRAGKTNIWYYTSGEAYGTSASETGAFYLGQGVYKSVDGGKSFSKLASTTPSSTTAFNSFWQLTWNIALDPSDDVNDVVYVATIGALYRSADGGDTWTAVLAGNISSSWSYFTDVAVTSTGVVYCVMSSDGPKKGISRSEDGINFTTITPAGFPAEYDRIVLGVNPNDENEVYFLGQTPNSGKTTQNYKGDPEQNSLWKYTYLSGDGAGLNGVWEDRSVNIPSNGTQFDNFNSQGGYDLVVKVKPGDGNTVFIGGTNLFRSTTAFSDSTNWVQIGGYGVGAIMPHYTMYPNHHPDQHALAFFPSAPDKLLSAHDGGLSLTTNSAASDVSWTSLNNGYITSQFYTVAIDQSASNDSTIVGGLQDNGTHFSNSLNISNTWSMPSAGDGSFCAIASGKSHYYFSRQSGQTIKTTLDANGNPTAFTRIDPVGGKDYQFINPFILDANNSNIMYMAAGNKIWRNSDLSQIALDNKYDSIATNWSMMQDTITIPQLSITALASSTVPANVLYYGTNKKRIYKVTDANGINPIRTDISSNKFPSSGNINCIAVDPRDANKVVVVFSNYSVYSLFYTTDGGTNWDKVAGNLEVNANGTGSGPSCRWLSILYVSNQPVYFVGTSVGLFSTTELKPDSTIWQQESADVIGSAVIDMIVTRESDGLVVVATHGNGIYSANIKPGDIVGVTEKVKGNSTVKVYPQPANTYVNFEFANVVKSGMFSVYNAEGKLIENILVKEEMLSNNRFVYNTNLLATGVYYYTMGLRNGKFMVIK